MLNPALKYCLCFLLFANFVVPQTMGQVSFFEKVDQFLKENVHLAKVDYKSIKKDPELLLELVKTIEAFPVSTYDKNTQKAFWINAYNLLTIHSILEQYPITSPLDIPGLFTQNLISIEGEELSLDEIEKIKLLKQFEDARIHFVVVCGAVSCSPLANFAYQPDQIEKQLDNQTKIALDDPDFLKINLDKREIKASEIFRWYSADFKPYGDVQAFINQYRTDLLPNDFSLKYYAFNWTLNDIDLKNQPQRYRASALIQKNKIELKVFNSMYTERKFDGFEKLNSRSTYFSSFFQFLYGLNSNFNIGGDIVIKSNVVNDLRNSFPLEALNFRNHNTFQSIECADPSHNLSPLSICKDNGMHLFDTLRMADGQVLETRSSAGLAHIGPKVKFNPIKKWTGFSLQQTLYIPVQQNVDGQFISFTQFFYDKPIKDHSQLFIEASLWTPVSPNFRVNPFFKVFYSYFPTNKWTVYAMTTIPFEVGAGTKYFITPKLEIEFLYTYYLPIDYFLDGRRPMTFNIGFRYNN